MKNTPPLFWEDENNFYVSEDAFKFFPPELLEIIEAHKQKGSEVLQVADKDIQHLMRLINAVPTTSSLSYIYHRLRTAEPSLTMEAVMEQETLTTAFVVTYSRLFNNGKGVSGLTRKKLPGHLRNIHDDLIEVRNERYAHNGGHKSLGSGIQILFDGEKFSIDTQLSIGFYWGGRNEWRELISFIDAYMHEQLYKILDRLKGKTGYEWEYPTGPSPEWVGDYGNPPE